MEDEKSIKGLIDYLKALREVNNPDLSVRMLIHSIEELLNKKDKAIVKKLLAE